MTAHSNSSFARRKPPHAGVAREPAALKTPRDSFGAFAVILSCAIFGQANLLAQERQLIVLHDAGLRSCPALACPVVAQLSILDPVHVQERATARNDENDGQEHWVRVIAAGSRLTGWIMDGYLGYPHRFAPVRNWRIEEFGYCMGDYCPVFRFTATGNFTLTFPACFDGLCPDPPDRAECPQGHRKRVENGRVHCLTEGQLYRAGDVVRAGGPGSREFLYLNRQGLLCADSWSCQTDGENTRENLGLIDGAVLGSSC